MESFWRAPFGTPVAPPSSEVQDTDAPTSLGLGLSWSWMHEADEIWRPLARATKAIMPKKPSPPKTGRTSRRTPAATHARPKRKKPAPAPRAEPAARRRKARAASEAGAPKAKTEVAPRQKRRPGAGAAPSRAASARTRTARKAEEPETGARSKFELGTRVKESPVAQIPWGFGQNRITAMVVDPRRMYAYWEVRDDAIEAARKALGPGGPGSWLNLRVYDISGRIFDGTNAHSYFDVEVDRHDRQWFFEIGKPTSTHCVEIGVKSSEGYFQKIARSGRVDLPRAEPSAPGPIEWLSVHEITDEIGAPVPGAPQGRPHAPAAVHRVPQTAHLAGSLAEGEHWVAEDVSALREWVALSGWETHDLWHTEWVGGHGRLEWFAGGQRFEWVGPLVHTSWESGLFATPVEAPGIVEERHEGPVVIQKLGDKTRILYGPWQVVIRGLGGHAEGRVLGRWEVRKSWVTSVGFEVQGGTLRWSAAAPCVAEAPGGSESLALGASERRWMVGSEVRLAGASEVFRAGASEFRYLGASEMLLGGASERGGASEGRLGGASETKVRSRYPAGARVAKRT